MTVDTVPVDPTVGSLVHARGRDCVVLGRDGPIVRLRPLSGERDVTGVLPALETLTEATFEPPDARHAGDAMSGKLLFDAARLSIRNGAAPFR